MSPKLVLVTCATGKQGGAVAMHLLEKRAQNAAQNAVQVRALTRDGNSAKAQALAASGAQIAVGDLNDSASLDAALIGVDTVFSVQDFWAKGVGYDGEVQQAVNLANAAHRVKVSHFVQSGMAQAEQIEAIEHFESKRAICDRIMRIGLPYSIIGTVYFMDNLYDPKRGGAMSFPTLSGTLKSNTKLHMLSVDDLGQIVKHIVMNRERYLGRHIDIASDCLTVPQMEQVYTKITGKTPKAWKLPAWMLRLVNKEFARQLAWQNESGWSFNLEESRAMHPALASFGQFIERHKLDNL